MCYARGMEDVMLAAGEVGGVIAALLGAWNAVQILAADRPRRRSVAAVDRASQRAGAARWSWPESSGCSPEEPWGLMRVQYGANESGRPIAEVEGNFPGCHTHIGRAFTDPNWGRPAPKPAPLPPWWAWPVLVPVAVVYHGVSWLMGGEGRIRRAARETKAALLRVGRDRMAVVRSAMTPLRGSGP